MLGIEEFFTKWEKTAWAFFSVSSFAFVIYRVSISQAERKSAAEARIVALESQTTELQNRVDKLSILCESQIETNKKAYAMAYGAMRVQQSDKTG